MLVVPIIRKGGSHDPSTPRVEPYILVPLPSAAPDMLAHSPGHGPLSWTRLQTRLQNTKVGQDQPTLHDHVCLVHVVYCSMVLFVLARSYLITSAY